MGPVAHIYSPSLSRFLYHYSPLDEMLVHRKGFPNIKLTGGERRKVSSKNTTYRPRPGLEFRPLDPESSALTLMPPHLSQQTKASRALYLKGNNQKKYSDGHNTERCYKPGHPVHSVRQAHHLHDLLQALFFLINDGLYGQRNSVNPRHCHTQWHHVLNDEHKTMREQEKKNNHVEYLKLCFPEMGSTVHTSPSMSPCLVMAGDKGCVQWNNGRMDDLSLDTGKEKCLPKWILNYFAHRKKKS